MLSNRRGIDCEEEKLFKIVILGGHKFNQAPQKSIELHTAKWQITLPCSEHLALTLEINEFRCYGAKIKESEKAGSHWELNSGHLA